MSRSSDSSLEPVSDKILIPSKSSLKGVLLYSPNHSTPSEELLELYKQSGYLIIGDGKTNITEQYIRELISATGMEVNSGTRWDIFAHGDISVLKASETSEKSIHLSWVADSHTPQPTRQILTIIRKISLEKPTEVHVHSCFGGASARDADELPKGSILICHGSENRYSTLVSAEAMVIRNIKHRQKTEKKGKIAKNKLDLNYILTSVHDALGQKCFVGISGVEETIRHRVSGRRSYTDKDIRKLTSSFVKEIYDKMKAISFDNEFIELSQRYIPPQITSKQIEYFRAERFDMEVVNSRPKFLKFVERPENKDYVLEQLEKKAGRCTILQSMLGGGYGDGDNTDYSPDDDSSSGGPYSHIPFLNSFLKSAKLKHIAKLVGHKDFQKFWLNYLYNSSTEDLKPLIKAFAKLKNSRFDSVLDNICEAVDHKDNLLACMLAFDDKKFNDLRLPLFKILGEKRWSKMLLEPGYTPIFYLAKKDTPTKEILRIFTLVKLCTPKSLDALCANYPDGTNILSIFMRYDQEKFDAIKDSFLEVFGKERIQKMFNENPSLLWDPKAYRRFKFIWPSNPTYTPATVVTPEIFTNVPSPLLVELGKKLSPEYHMKNSHTDRPLPSYTESKNSISK